MLGTLAYMAPEQSEGKPAGEPADLYSLALVLYEALSGDNPVRGANPAETARRIGRPVEPLRPAPPRPPRRAHRRDRHRPGASPHGPGGLGTLRAALEDAHRTAEQARHPPAPRRAAARAAAAAARPRAARTRAPDLGRRPARGLPRRAAAAAGARGRVAASPRAEAEPRVVVHAGEAPRRGAPRRLALAGLIALCCWEAIAGRAGLSLVLLVALLPALLVLSGHGRSARVPFGRLSCALAPLLGTGRPGRRLPGGRGAGPVPSERALRGALGYWWLTLAGPLLSARLWLPAPAGTPATRAWEESVGQAATHVVAPALSVGVLLGALLWAAAAMVLPWIVRGREPLLDAIAAGLWALALVLVQPMLDAGLAGRRPRPAPGRRARGAPRRLRGARGTRAAGSCGPAVRVAWLPRAGAFAGPRAHPP